MSKLTLSVLVIIFQLSQSLPLPLVPLRTSIAAQKIVDERHGPFKTTNISSSTRKSRDFDHFYLASSAFKGKDEGCVNSYKALRYYQNEGAKMRDEILKEVSE